MEGAWQHDMYGGGSGGRSAPAPAARSGGSAKIMVANLNSTVVKDEDMKVRAAGPLRDHERAWVMLLPRGKGGRHRSTFAL